MSFSETLVTCGLPYVNGPAHIGHLRTYIPADIYVRFLRKLSKKIAFVCGSDSHGTPIIVNAEELGVHPKELVEKYHKHFQEIFSKLNIIFDFYGSTDSQENHKRTQDIVEKLLKNGYIYPKLIKLAYCERCRKFLPDRYVEGSCPYCGAPARGDECDQGCGRHLEPGEIKDARCKLCGSEAKSRSQQHYFFRLSSFRDFLNDFLQTLEGTSNAKHYAMEWLKKELRDWCITRNLEWGVKFPGTDLVVYVWVDAPIGYITFTPEWEKYWRAPSRIIHFIGSDIIYHHCIFWPALLRGAGLTPPSAVVASGMVTIEGNKFSKSRGYVVWVKDDYLDQGFHPDLLRYYLATYTSHTKELDFSWKVFQSRVNTELVGILGNFIHRTLSFAYKNFHSIPDGTIEKGVIEKIGDVRRTIVDELEKYEFKKIVDKIMSLATYGNSYFQAEEPWKLIRKDRERVGSILKNCLQLIKAIAIFLEPVLPSKMKDAWDQLGMDSDLGKVPLEEALVEIDSGRELREPEIIFEKIGDEKIEKVELILKKRLEEAGK
jgi:methionyl-tRNA synthetase